jgi:hypothetical protein
MEEGETAVGKESAKRAPRDRGEAVKQEQERIMEEAER